MSDQSFSAFPNLQETLETEEQLVEKLLKEKIDRLGGLAAKYAKAKETVKEYDELRKVIQSEVCEGKPGTAVVTEHGFQFAIQFTAGPDLREVSDKAELYKALGEDKFVELAKFTLKDVDAYCTPDECAKILKLTPGGGDRRHKILKRK